jgi:hypothetical protein
LIQDVSGTPLRDFYIMPVDFTIHYTDNTSETFTVQNDRRNQMFYIHTVKEPDHIVFDEKINILKVKDEILGDPCDPTLIQLSSFSAARELGKVILEWTTESELDNAGFNVLRAESEGGEYAKINTALIPAQGSLTQGASYEFVDGDVRYRKSYWYKLEDIDLNGRSTMHGPVKVSPRLLFGLRGGMMQ